MKLREKLVDIAETSIRDLGGEPTVLEVHKYVWNNYEEDLRASGDDFYVWQYELRWAAQKPVDDGTISKVTPRGVWRLLKD